MTTTVVCVSDTREQLKRSLDDVDEGTLQRMKKALTAKRAPRNTAAVKAEPVLDWRPRRYAETMLAIQLLEQRCGLRQTPFHVEGQIFTHKFTVAELVEAMLLSFDVGHTPKPVKLCTVKKESRHIYLGLCVSSLMSRVVEECNARLKSNPDASISVEKAPLDHRPGWAPHTAKGAGVISNQNGLLLFNAALGSVKTRLLANREANSPPSDEDDELALETGVGV